MATRTWDDGAADGVFITATNWSADTAPIDGDTAIIAASSRSIAAADNSGIELAALRILPGWGGTAQGLYIGGSGSTLKIDATELEINNSRFSYVNLEGIYATVYARNIGGGTLYFGPTSDIGVLYVPPGGKVIVDTGAKLAEVWNAGVCQILGDTSSPDDMEVHNARGAVMECSRRIALGYNAGVLKCLGAAEGDISAGTSKIHNTATASMYISGTGNYDFISVESGGLIDGTKQIGGATKPTITALRYADGARIALPKALFTYTSEPIGSDETTGPG